MVFSDDALSQPKQATGLSHTQIDLFCERFREYFHVHPNSAIESVLNEVPSEARRAVLSELIAEEVQLLRLLGGMSPSPEIYHRRFPEDRTAIEVAFQLLGSGGGGKNTDVSSAGRDTRNNLNALRVLVADGHAADVCDEPLRFGPYLVLNKLGSGTFGSVYKAQHESDGSVVAIKLLKAHWAQDSECGEAMRRQFAEEAQMMLQFDHPRVVKVISLDERAEPPYFVQEYIDGETLHSRLQLARPTVQEAIEYAIQIADGLAHIHSRERWHRDLKPANILLDRNNGVYLADFGLALEDAQRWSSAQGLVGTYPYMAPEQIRGATHRLNARCDVWALGVILYEMLTGRRPFRGQTREQLCDEILERTPAAPRELNQAIPRELNRLCMQCLAKRDTDRPHAAADLRDDLAQLLERLRHECLDESSDTSRALPSSLIARAMTDTVKTCATPLTVQYPIPTLKRFTAEQAELYLRLMPRGYATEDELPALIAFWKQRIIEVDPDRTFSVGILVGVSGCGKSSMLEAGLVPSLPESVLPILVEASESDTEMRILNKLQRGLPEADPEKKWSLVDWAFRLRSGKLLPPGQKVIFILDQFEQWLNAHGGESKNHVLDALQQCDGEHLQAIVCVREGFHATLMRFVQSLDVHLDDQHNYATAHRFTADHARYVLTQFGRGLKRLDEPLTAQQQAFIDATIDGLAESDRGVVCVRLVVLALVMQDRVWTVEELDQLGGLDGIGYQFLVDCFEGRTASEQYRRYLPAAMKVLAELLPVEGPDIKEVRSYAQLFVASELDKLQFDDLLNILVRKLFVLTPVEQVIASSAHVSSKTIEDNRSTLGLFYQLTHDFLVPSIREWLSRKLRETKEGRAQLRLQELTAAWNSKPENRNLPSVWEWLSIRRLTDGRKWTAHERAVMRRTSRRLLQRGVVVALSITSMVLLAVFTRSRVNELRQREEQTRMERLDLVEQRDLAEASLRIAPLTARLASVMTSGEAPVATRSLDEIAAICDNEQIVSEHSIRLRSLASLYLVRSDIVCEEEVYAVPTKGMLGISPGPMQPACIAYEDESRKLFLGEFKAPVGMYGHVGILSVEDRVALPSLEFAGISKPTTGLSGLLGPLAQATRPQNGIRSLAVSGEVVVAGTRYGEIFTWADGAKPSRAEHFHGETSHHDSVIVELSPDAKTLITAGAMRSSGESIIRRWNWSDSHWEPDAERRLGSKLFDMRVSWDRGIIFCACANEISKIDLNLTEATVLTEGAARVSPHPVHDVVAYERPGTIYLSTGPGLGFFLSLADAVEPPLELQRMDIDPSGRYLFAGYRTERKLRAWDLLTGRLLARQTIGNPVDAQAGYVECAEDGSHVFVTVDTGVKEYSIVSSSSRLIESTIGVGHGLPRGAAASSDLDVFATYDGQQRVRVFGKRELEDSLIHTFSTNLPINGVTISPSGRWLIVAIEGGEVQIVDLDSRVKEVHSLALSTNAKFLSFSGDKDELFVVQEARGREPGEREELLAVVLPQTAELEGQPVPLGTELRKMLFGRGGAKCLAMGSRGLIIGTDAPSLLRFGISDGPFQSTEHVAESITLRERPSAIGFDSTGQVIAVGNIDGSIELIELSGNASLQIIPKSEGDAFSPGHSDEVTAIEFTQGHSAFVSAGKDGKVVLWAKHGEQYQAELVLPFTRPVIWLKSNSTGTRLAFLVEGETGIRLWSLDALRQSLTEVSESLAW